MVCKSPKETLLEILQWLKDKHEIACATDGFKWGHKCKTVFRANKLGQSLVVKIGLTSEAKREVLMNQEGYRGIREIGADKYLPHPCIIAKFRGVPILIMENCGENFFEMIKRANVPGTAYDNLAGELMCLYRATSRSDWHEKIIENLLLIGTELEKQFRRHLSFFEPFATSEHLFESIKRRFSLISVSSGCFACWDFTPEDIFLAPDGLKIIDPPGIVFGLPIVDLACFAGVARDVYGLPGAEHGYRRLYKLSREVGAMLGISSADSKMLFNLGRALQCSLSSRFQIAKDPARAKKFFLMAKRFIVKCSL